MRALSEITTSVTSKNFSRKFVSIGKIVALWPEVMGTQFAHKATPNRLLYRKPKSKNEQPRAILEIATSSADATLIHYQKDIILERLEQLFGQRWIHDIKFISVSRIQLQTRKKNRTAPLTQKQKNHLSTLLGDVEDQDIQRRLLSLGQAILGKEQS